VARRREEEEQIRAGIIALGFFGDCGDGAADVEVRKELTRLFHVGRVHGPDGPGVALYFSAEFLLRTTDRW
jgi:hypothetical protein